MKEVMSKLPLFVANWKMYKNGEEVDSFFDHLFSCHQRLPFEQMMIAPPYLWIERAQRKASVKSVRIGAQNSSSYEEGAYTGEISAKMLASAGCSFSLVGHSERRAIFHETLEQIHLKLSLLISHSITPILCVGESKEERKDQREKEIIQNQLLSAIEGLGPHKLENLIIAYEPVWSIGTGELPDPSLISDMHQFCKHILKGQLGHHADRIQVLYGGSVKADNVQSLLREKDVDGVLVGGASLSPEQFIDIILKGTQL